MYDNDEAFIRKKNHRLSVALLISVALNIGVLAILSYWLIRERPPTPYYYLKPATWDQQQIPLADQRNCLEVITGLQQLSFGQLLNKLRSTKQIENGFTERDLALSTLVTFHYFDLEAALNEKPSEKRQINWKNPITGETKPIIIYPGLTEPKYASIIHFATTERWPLTSQGLFWVLQKQKIEQNIDPTLAESFILSPEFLSIELQFNRLGKSISKQRILEMLLEGNWDYLAQFSEQQKQINDLSLARRQKLLLDYIKQNSETAAYLLLEVEPDFAVKKLDDTQTIAVLQLLTNKTPESEKFALNLLSSPRSNSVWQQASLRLYEYAGEPIPKDWNYSSSLKRFAPERAIALDSPAKPKSIEKPKNKIVEKTIAVNKPTPKAPVTKALAVVPKKTESYRSYIIQEGDSLWKISRRFGVDMEVLKKKNQLKSNAIKPGTVLKIP